jgi:hydroxymethylpyrimidine pyrophosphatase-like HAD family hydrolase
MRYLALATDYDGTLAHHGVVAGESWEAVRRLRASGRKVLLVTGRELDDLVSICPHLDLFDRVVAENGALLYRPDTRQEHPLAPPPPAEFVRALQQRGVRPLGVGRSIVATVEPHQTTALQAIHDLGLELQVIFNKGAVMVLPAGVNKATGLCAALDELGLSPHNVVGVGDAENDHAFMNSCECSVAVANALPAVQKRADFVTPGAHGIGVRQLIDELLTDDLRGRESLLGRHHILLGRRLEGAGAPGEVHIAPYGTSLMVAGPSGSGKSTVTTGIVERLAGAGYQFCLIDPEGDYDNLQEAVVLGDTKHPPSVEEVLKLLRQSRQNVVVSLLGVAEADRPLFFAGMLPRIQELRANTGRPHWLVLDEAHHLLPAAWDLAEVTVPQHLETALLITVHPDMVARAVLHGVDVLLAVGPGPADTLAKFAGALGEAVPEGAPETQDKGEVTAWRRGPHGEPPFRLRTEPGQTERRRHSRKYAEGELPLDRSFYFRGPQEKLNLRAHNLILFVEMAQGVDEDTWRHHLRQGDYSRWLREAIKDQGLAAEVEAVERQPDLPADESRALVRDAIARRYTLPATVSGAPAGGPADGNGRQAAAREHTPTHS